MLAIVTFHFLEVTYFQPEIYFSKEDSWLLYWLTSYSRYTSFSGFIIVSLAAYMMGFSDSLKKFSSKTYAMFFLFIIGGFVIFPALWGLGFAAEWDIYHFVFLSCFALLIIRQFSSKVLYAFGALGFILLWIPFWNWEHWVERHWWVHEIVIGICREEMKRGTWPILPWLGLPIMSYALGHWCKANIERLRRLGPWDMIFIPVLLLSLPNALIHFRHPDVGPGFYCYVNRSGPISFWSSMIWVYFFIRLSLVTSINQRLMQTPLLKDLPKMQLSKNFALFYVVQIIYIHGIALIPALQSKSSGWLACFIVFTIIPAVDVLVWIIKKIYLKAKSNIFCHFKNAK